jgi:hypothetical protein
MAGYRIYYLNGDNRISMADWIEAKDDDHAIQQAREFSRKFSRSELWQKERLVAKLAR